MNLEINSAVSQFNRKITAEFKGKALPEMGYAGLDWERIDKVAQNAFSHYEEVQTCSKKLSLKGRVEAYRELSKSLRSVADHISRSKSLWQKFLSLFCSLSTEEKKFSALKARIEKAYSSSRSDETKLWVGSHWLLRVINFISGWHFGTEVNDRIQERRMSPFNQLKNASFRTMGSHRVRSKKIEGQNPLIALEDIAADLKGFLKLAQNDLSAADKAELKNINRVIDDAGAFLMKVETANVLHHHIPPFLQESVGVRKQNQSARVADLVFMVQQKIQQLKAGEFLLLPSYYTSMKNQGGHAVVFEIAKNQNGTYTFTLVNTGNGVGAFSGLFTYLKSAMTKQFHDDVIPNLTLEDVTNPEFLTNSIELLFNQEGSLKALFDPIVKHLAKGDVKNIKQGRRHWIQTNGTCAHDSVICWMEGRINPVLFSNLMVYMTARGNKLLEKVSQDPALHTVEAEVEEVVLKGQPLFAALQEFGNETLETRKKAFEGVLQEEKERGVTLEKKQQLLKSQVQLLKSKAKKWEEMLEPQHLQHLAAKVDRLQKNYCLLSGQDPSKVSSPYGFFSFISAPNPKVAEAWKAFQAALLQYQKLQELWGTEPFKAKVRLKITEKQKAAALAQDELVKCSVKAAECAERIKAAQKVSSLLEKQTFLTAF